MKGNRKRKLDSGKFESIQSEHNGSSAVQALRDAIDSAMTGVIIVTAMPPPSAVSILPQRIAYFAPGCPKLISLTSYST